MPDGSADRCAEVVLDEEISAAHLVERVGVHGAVAQELVGGSVEAAGSGAGDDVDLPAARAAHFGRVAAGLYLELLHGVGRSAEVLGAESGIGVGGAVEQEVIRVGAAAADADRGALAGPPIQRIHVAGRRSVTRCAPRAR